MVQEFNHEVIIPRDPQSGQPTGQSMHKPVVITAGQVWWTAPSTDQLCWSVHLCP
jgi:hypothetical protein